MYGTSSNLSLNAGVNKSRAPGRPRDWNFHGGLSICNYLHVASLASRILEYLGKFMGLSLNDRVLNRCVRHINKPVSQMNENPCRSLLGVDKGNGSPEHATKWKFRSGGTAPLILNLNNRWRWVNRLTNPLNKRLCVLFRLPGRFGEKEHSLPCR